MARDALQDQREALRHAGVTTTPSTELLLVADTNALYANPALEEWATDQEATLVVVPQLLRELDKHKTHHPAESARQKAVSLIRRFGEFGRRGDTFEGVKLAGRLNFREVALDPDPSEVGLRTENDDDKLLASALALKWRTPTASVVLVTGDQNMRNKARIFGLTTDEPQNRPSHHRPDRPRAEDGGRKSRLATLADR